MQVTTHGIYDRKILRSPRNFFRKLDGIPKISELYLAESFTKQQLCLISHITSSRQMPFMGIRTERKAQKDFIEVITSNFHPSPEHISRMTSVANRIGRMCTHISPRPADWSAHISVTSSGELMSSIKEGGQSYAVYTAACRYLAEVPEEDALLDSPFGPVVKRKGIPLWKTLFRTEIEQQEVLDQTWLSVRPLIKDQDHRFWGLDNAFGRQLMYCAYLDSIEPVSTGDIIIRATCVPEMGNKARFVTISEYWLNTLMAPLAHLLVELLKCHPTVWGSFHRMDQTWACCQGLTKVDFTQQFTNVLSSDLKDATNAQDMTLSRAMLRGFLVGAGYNPHSPYIKYVLDLIRPRLVYFQDGTVVRSSRGIFMGEAIAKPALTLLNVCVEELSFLTYTGQITSCLFTEAPSIPRPWRFCYIAGDDHLAVGPQGYLRTITRIHRASGSLISPEKHCISKIFVKFTEKIIDLQSLGEPNTLTAEQIIIDSVKVRLLSQGQSTLIKKDNKNVAIGKALQLGKTLSWLPAYLYPPGKISSIRALFLIRMGPFMPSFYKNRKAWHQIHLPRILGGLDLVLKDEYTHFVKNSSYPVQLFVASLLEGKRNKDVLTALSRLNCNVASRGVTSILKYRDEIIDQLTAYPSTVDAIDYRALREMFPDDSNLKIIEKAEANGYYSIERYAELVTRGNLFQELLMGTGKRKIFQTTPYVRQFARIWPYLVKSLEGQSIPNWDEVPSSAIKRCLNGLNWSWFINVDQLTSFDLGLLDENGEDLTFDFVEAPLLEGFRQGFPNLYLGGEFLYKGKI